jgi:hypothetical protein
LLFENTDKSKFLIIDQCIAAPEKTPSMVGIGLVVALGLGLGLGIGLVVAHPHPISYALALDAVTGALPLLNTACVGV